MNVTMKSCLFGGALFAAGVPSNEANAHSWSHYQGATVPTTYAFIVAYDYIADDKQLAYSGYSSSPAVNYSASVANGTTGMVSWDAPGGTWDNSAITASAGSSYLFTQLVSGFSVSKNSLLEVSWDFSDFSAGDLTTWVFGDQTGGAQDLIDGLSLRNVLDTPSQSAGPIGSVLLPLDSTRTYWLSSILSTSNAGVNGSVHARVLPIPAPGAAPLFGIAGLIAFRRKRTA